MKSKLTQILESNARNVLLNEEDMEQEIEEVEDLALALDKIEDVIGELVELENVELADKLREVTRILVALKGEETKELEDFKVDQAIEHELDNV